MSSSNLTDGLCDNCTLNTTDPFTFGCKPPETIPGVPRSVTIVQAICILLINIASLGLNAFVLFMIVRFKKLHQQTFILALQIIIPHLIASLTVMPVSFASAVADKWLLGDVGCNIFGTLHDGHLSTRYLFMLVLTLDRVFTVFVPFWYAIHGRKVAQAMSIFTWVILTIRLILPLKGVLDCSAYVSVLKICTGIGSCSTGCNVFLSIWITGVVIFTQITPFVLYIGLFVKAKALIRRHLPSKVWVKENSTQGAQEERARRWQKDRRAVWTVFILFLAFIIFTIPPFLLYFIQFVIFKQADIIPPPEFSSTYMLVTRTCLFLQAVADPIVIMRNKDFREAVECLNPCSKHADMESVPSSQSGTSTSN